MLEWLTEAIGPLAAGVIAFGVVPALVLLLGMAGISRLVEWRAGRDR